MWNLMLGLGEDGYDWELVKVGGEEEKEAFMEELAELKGNLAKVEGWKKRRKEIDGELGQVFVRGGGVLEEVEYPESVELVGPADADVSL